jgi:hypothetical protein
VDLDDGGWHHVLTTYDGIRRAVYVDGILIGADVPGANNATAANFRIGSTNFGEWFQGSIDEVALYDYGLAPNQIAALAAGVDPASLPAAAARLVAHWVADDYQTPGTPWVDRIGGILATPGGAPLPGANGVYFNGVDDQFAIAAADNPIAGLHDFTATVIFMADGNLGQGGDNKPGVPDFWASAHLMGNEQAGAGVGDWGIGLDGNDAIRAGVGLAGDVTIREDAAAYNDALLHMATMVMDAETGVLKLFVDGALVDVANVTPATLIDSGFFLGTNGAPAPADLFFFNGFLLEAGLHDMALSDRDVLALHELGTLVAPEVIIPEPASLALLGLGALVLTRRHRRE